MSTVLCALVVAEKNVILGVDNYEKAFVDLNLSIKMLG